MSHLRRIVIEQATEADLAWIDKLAGFSYYEENTRDLLERGLRDDLAFWRIGPAEGLDGILAARIVPRLKLRDFWIEFICGYGLIARAQEIHDEIWELAKMAECSRVSGIAQHRALARVYEKVLGVKPSATIFSEDRSNGQR